MGADRARTTNASPARAVAAVVVAVLVALAGLAYVESPLLRDGLISGGWGDTRIQIAILQNWSNCLAGAGDCLSPNYFFPISGTLGYNDAYLVSGVLYHLARRLGLDPFLAYEAVYAVVRLIGFASVLALGMQGLRLRFPVALLAALLALVSINVVNRVIHTQLLYGAFVPLGLLLMIRLLRALRRLGAGEADAPVSVWPAHAAAVALGALAFAWALTAYYSFFFFALFGAAVAVFHLLADRPDAAACGRAFVRHPSMIATAVAAALPAPLGLLLVYGRSLRETGGHPWFAGHYPKFSDLLNVGPDNLVWSRLAGLPERLTGRPPTLDELAAGYPVLFLAGFVTTLVWLVARRRSPGFAAADSGRRESDALALALAAASALTMLVVLRYGGGYSPWQLAWWAVPGARAIRIPGRFLVFLTPVSSLVLAYGLTALTDRLRPRWRGIAIAAAAALLLVEQISVRPPFFLNRDDEVAFLASIPPAPPGCRAFAVTVPRLGPTMSPELDIHYVHAVDAMLIAAVTGLPTVNGVASFSPKGWDLTRPFDADYPARVQAYAAAHGLADRLCGLDLKSRRWSVPGE